MRILFVGDVFGKPGRKALTFGILQAKKKHDIHLVIANGENSAGGSGITQKTAEEMFNAGVDIITGGNHVLDKPDIEMLAWKDNRIVLPANMKDKIPTATFRIAAASDGTSVAVINLLGKVYMKEDLRCPFATADELIKEISDRAKVIFVDFHAEATSEKRALFHYLSGRVSAVIGSHTHIQTADEEISELGTAYLTDAGMTGPHDSVIGLKKEHIVKKFITGEKVPFRVAKKGVKFQAVVVDIDQSTGKAVDIQRINMPVEI